MHNKMKCVMQSSVMNNSS